ncbi:hypothetical protein GOP47_0008156 [Adiantum capillus-veneris]|uniref:MBD domain-containing protein n=1 Tax=Adiantum capillus-veneris TaxID=13818 RepID=A0A9D4ZK64_ADICA|nr:hypothetical protein GOP47_0008156 [Adiantum capillus-veneris]
MAFQQQEEEDLAFAAAYEDDTPTPSGWRRKLVPRIGKSMVPIRTDVIFVTPSGEEFNSRAQLQRYLKANKGSPSLSEFIWIVDGISQRSTRSKAAPIVKLEIPARADSKRKVGAGVNGVGNGKRSRTTKTQKSEKDLRILEGKRSKNTDMETIIEGKDEGVEFTGSSPASAKKKRSVKVRKNKAAAPTLADSPNTNGVADINNKDNKAEETVKKSFANKASKRIRSKGRSAAKKNTIPQDPSDDVRQETHVGVNADVSIASATNAESDGNGKGEGDHPEEEADVVEHSNDAMTENA